MGRGVGTNVGKRKVFVLEPVNENDTAAGRTVDVHGVGALISRIAIAVSRLSHIGLGGGVM